MIPQASQSIPSRFFALLFSIFDNLVSGDRARPVRAVRPLPDNFFIFAQLHAQDLPRQIRAPRRGSLDYAFLFSRFHLPPPHALCRVTIVEIISTILPTVPQVPRVSV